MTRQITKLVIGAGLMAIATQVGASEFLIDMQGAAGKRVNVYASDAIMDHTPINDDLANPDSNRVIQIDLTMVYEAVDQPLWLEYQLQFKCPKSIRRGRGAPKHKADSTGILDTPDSVEFRVASGAKTMKQDPAIIDLQPTDWQSTTSYTMRQAWNVACNSASIGDAKQAAAVDRVVKSDTLRAKLADIGLNGLELVPAGLSMSSLADFTWETLWSDVPKPAINRGRKLTPAESAALTAKLAQMQQQVTEAQGRVQGNLAAMKADMDFTQIAAEYRGKRRLSRSESLLIQVWLGKTEQEVVAANGNPAVRQAGIARTLSYGQAFDNRVMWQNLVTGATYTGGGYKSCNVRYALIPDSAGMLRVADVNIFVDSSGDTSGMGRACADILNVPNG
ncbi:hypothetical protein XB05_10605 [Xanthomonas arboricola]|uniref:hypothetical protein n=1 Tax=Xanthomonas arboricola TaxID=56448 RepID=UPI00061A1ED7|nr:hypothetical protein [Xanthomonas arboricola]AKC79143.1 hypothetical protein XB05_10605 [Xanthomonas arboricola]